MQFALATERCPLAHFAALYATSIIRQPTNAMDVKHELSVCAWTGILLGSYYSTHVAPGGILGPQILT